ncbi:HDOD domain-containing protein [Motilimonas sp. 1_MG-2023]|uniref:HDOD domain-containing protein n=1 Tax=Motilimonas sp. 1_MG-2023 TaxID=3062672 RepID=UPI0026E24707|nr:HDOD domain-containing protein [Motilimonas sp. 1_MG-2023]MDO6527560.1 HDOD domain-containing protein [Motilimonas sp. 1_MG-2023]
MDIQILFSKLDKLPTIPKVVQELIQTFNNDDADIVGVANKIALDPVISAKVLRLVNSAHFSRGKDVTSIEDAVIRLGFNTVRTLVMASGISSSFKHFDNFDQKAFWGDTFRVASICKSLAKQTSHAPDTAFTCAMLHKLGELIILIADTEEDEQRMAAKIEQGLSREEAEAQVLGFNYAEVGAELAKRWKFSDSFVHAIEDQLTPLSAETFNEDAGFICMASFFNHAWQQDWSEEEIEKHYNKALAIRLELSLSNILNAKEAMLEESKALTDLLN